MGCRYWPVDGCAGTGNAVWASGSCEACREYELVPGFNWGSDLSAHQVIATPKEHSKIDHTYLL